MDMSELRAEIDRIDSEIIRLLKTRFDVAREIGEAKKGLDLEVEDLSRDRLVLENYKENAGSELDEGFIEELVSLILRYSKEVQKK
ncbi:MAG TPA: chorismate mutase [Euryarchaeota archaeon]|nr:chorismate mutase [Euryarchaeota archaeon]